MQRSISTTGSVPIVPGLTRQASQDSVKDIMDRYDTEHWATAKGSSIYIQWIPDEMTESTAEHFFRTYGNVDRIEIVHKMKDGMKIGRMLFVHYTEWYDTFLPDAIAKSHPNPVILDYGITKQFNTKIYKLKCMINMRPIPKVDYSASQLTDMFENLQQKFSSMSAMTAQNIERMYCDLQQKSDAIAHLQADNLRLQMEMEAMQKRMQVLEQIDLSDAARFEEVNKRLERVEMKK